jgi:transcriptional regulator with XRE-family HTH domain
MRRSSPNKTAFSEYIRLRRQELGLSLPELEQRTGIHNSRLSRWERGIDMPDRPDRLAELARGLEVPLADLFTVAGIELPSELPTLRPYLRTKYGDQLPDAALAEIARYTDEVAKRYGVQTGPLLGEDEIVPVRGPNSSDDENLL